MSCRGRRRVGIWLGALASVAAALGGCAPVMTTRYQAVPLTELGEPHDEPWRFELGSGATVDMRVMRSVSGVIEGRDSLGRSIKVDVREVRRAGVGYEEKDVAATSIKTLRGITSGYAAFLLGMVLLVAMGR